MITGSIRGDHDVEPDATFKIRLRQNHTPNEPPFGNTTATVTIVNDDAWPTGEAIPLLSGEAMALLMAAVAVAGCFALRRP